MQKPAAELSEAGKSSDEGPDVSERESVNAGEEPSEAFEGEQAKASEGVGNG